MHDVADTGVVWYGGTGHRILGTDDGIECYRCGMAACGDAYQELIPDCAGPDVTGHHWVGIGAGNECAYGDAYASAENAVRESYGLAVGCTRA